MSVEQPQPAAILRFAEWRAPQIADVHSKWRWMPVATALTLTLSVLAFCVLTKASPIPILFPFLVFIPLSWIARDATGIPQRDLRTLIDLPATTLHVPVQISLHDGIFCIGRDEGVISFVEDWVLFEGLRLSFAVHASTFAQLRNCLPRLSVPHTGSYQLSLEVGGQRRTLRVLPFDSFDGKSAGLQRAFAKELAAAKNCRYDESSPETWPPFKADPIELRRADSRAFGTFLAWELLGAPTLLLVAVTVPELSEICFIVLAMVIATFVYKAAKQHTLRKLRNPTPIP